MAMNKRKENYDHAYAARNLTAAAVELDECQEWRMQLGARGSACGETTLSFNFYLLRDNSRLSNLLFISQSGNPFLDFFSQNLLCCTQCSHAVTVLASRRRGCQNWSELRSLVCDRDTE